MILTCPDCATSYFVDDARVPASGRTVKCTSCGARWRAVPEAERELEDDFPPLPPPVSEPVAAIVEAPEPALVAALEPTATEPAPVPAPRQPARPTQAAARPPSIVLGGLTVAAALALGVAAALLFRNAVVRIAPGSAPVYAALGLAAQPLLIEEVKTQATFQGGRPVLSVTGAIRNTQPHTLEAPPLRISLLDKAGKPIAAKLVRPLNAAIPAGARRYFAVAIAEPPVGLSDLKVVFEGKAEAARGGPPQAPPEPPAAAAAAAPAPADAQPLPPGSPDALPTHG